MALTGAGLTTRLPPMASFTMLTRSPYSLCSRRDRSFIQRSFSFKVVWVPSVMKSPKAQITTVPAGAITSTASRKNHEVVVNS